MVALRQIGLSAAYHSSVHPNFDESGLPPLQNYFYVPASPQLYRYVVNLPFSAPYFISQPCLIKMSAIGSLVFCTDCGNLLDSSTGDANTLLTCACCGTENRGKLIFNSYYKNYILIAQIHHRKQSSLRRSPPRFLLC